MQRFISLYFFFALDKKKLPCFCATQSPIVLTKSSENDCERVFLFETFVPLLYRDELFIYGPYFYIILHSFFIIFSWSYYIVFKIPRCIFSLGQPQLNSLQPFPFSKGLGEEKVFCQFS